MIGKSLSHLAPSAKMTVSSAMATGRGMGHAAGGTGLVARAQYVGSRRAAGSAAAHIAGRQKGAAAARRGSTIAKWVKSPRVRKAAMIGGVAAGGYGVARAVTKSGTGTDKTGYGQARGMYNY